MHEVWCVCVRACEYVCLNGRGREGGGKGAGSRYRKHAPDWQGFWIDSSFVSTRTCTGTDMRAHTCSHPHTHTHTSTQVKRLHTKDSKKRAQQEKAACPDLFNGKNRPGKSSDDIAKYVWDSASRVHFALPSLRLGSPLLLTSRNTLFSHTPHSPQARVHARTYTRTHAHSHARTHTHTHTHRVYVVPQAFVDEWRRFVSKPAQHDPPSPGTEHLLCPHNGLLYTGPWSSCFPHPPRKCPQMFAESVHSARLHRACDTHTLCLPDQTLVRANGDAIVHVHSHAHGQERCAK